MLRETQQLLHLSRPPHQTWGHRAKPKTMKFRPRSLQRPQTQTSLQKRYLVQKAHRGHGEAGGQKPPCLAGSQHGQERRQHAPGPTSHLGSPDSLDFVTNQGQMFRFAEWPLAQPSCSSLSAGIGPPSGTCVSAPSRALPVPPGHPVPQEAVPPGSISHGFLQGPPRSWGEAVESLHGYVSLRTEASNPVNLVPLQGTGVALSRGRRKQRSARRGASA